MSIAQGKTVYFAKSNACSSTTVAAVRLYLKSHYSVSEYSGKGTYSHHPMLRCDYLVILPEKPSLYSTNLGRGLHDQIKAFKAAGAKSERIIIITDIDELHNDIIGASTFRTVELTGRSSWVTYATVYTNNDVDEELSKLIVKEPNPTVAMFDVETMGTLSYNPCGEIPLGKTFDGAKFETMFERDQYGYERGRRTSSDSRYSSSESERRARDRDADDFARRLSEAREHDMRVAAERARRDAPPVTPKEKVKDKVEAYLLDEGPHPSVAGNFMLLLG